MEHLVLYHPDAVVEFESIRDKQARKKILSLVAILSAIGPKITEPHAKKIQGEKKLFELRPGGGKTLFRPIYAKLGDQFVILAIGPESQVDARGFVTAVEAAKRRAKDDFGADF